ncbi:MAG TPA: helix-turn-helix transcriptional regulator [Gaiellaceae bacterium]|nr:helix-turn-helix transcriptional regulator [Gaiellaceae bacterium]
MSIASVELHSSAHRGAVEYVIEEVGERLDERFSLEELAALVFFSPYHFHRIFRQVTGVPPGRFFGALRIEAAKRLLLTSDLSVGEVCLEVGYRSIGTFTSQFSRLVGVSPRTFRNLGQANGSFLAEAAELAPPPPPAGATLAVTGRLELDGDERPRSAAVGLFPTPLAEGRPIACALAAAPGRYELRADCAGSFHVLAVTVEPAADWRGLLLHGADLRVASSRGPVRMRAGAPPRAVDLVLRPRRLVDPPILVPPVLLALAPAQKGRAA